ncbi:hypothetical protein F5Y18DRAFT_388408 [Xylariaceae sp. FL1019]|nr:hypothetical protein F5Y18DRAFT_388408 [Xylariaceae sp. FL1019]
MPPLHRRATGAGTSTSMTQPLPITINGSIVTSMTWFPETGKPRPTSVHSELHHMSSHNSSIVKTLPPKPTTTRNMWSSVHPPPPGRANSTHPHFSIPLTVLTTLSWSALTTSDPVDTLHPTPPFGTQNSAYPPSSSRVSTLDSVGHLTVSAVPTTSDPVDTLHPPPPFGTQISADPPSPSCISTLVSHATVCVVPTTSRGSTDDVPNLTTPTGGYPTPTRSLPNHTHHLTRPTEAPSTLGTQHKTTPTGHIPTPALGPTEDMSSLTRRMNWPTEGHSTLLTVVRRV